jgi:hypothetical protein
MAHSPQTKNYYNNPNSVTRSEEAAIVTVLGMSRFLLDDELVNASIRVGVSFH